MAAGQGFKTFLTGDVLTASDVNGYLMQGIWVFASAAARDAAVTAPQEGNFAFLKDTNVTTYYTGSAWTNLDTTGMVNPMTTTGDTIYSSSGSTPARLGIGSTGQVLTVAAGVPSWATPAGGGGKVLQVVSAENATNFSTTSTTPQATGLTVSITPTLATSKVLVLLSQAFQIYSSGNEANGLVSLLRDATIIADNVPNAYIGYRSIGATDVIGTCSYVINYLDTPATTSSLTYTTKIRVQTSATMTAYAQPSGLRSTIVLMEIGA